MDYTIKVSDDRRYIVLTVVGEFTAKSFMKCVVETHTFGREHGIHFYLVEATRARNIDSVSGNYKFAYSDMPKTEGIDPLAVVAVVASPDDHSHDFVETVSNNAGMPLKIFRDYAQAVEYLIRCGSDRSCGETQHYHGDDHASSPAE